MTLTVVRITCCGVNEIGGNEVVVQDRDVRFSFDLGTSFKRRYEYFEECLKPRPGVGLPDVLCMGLLPLLEGIYREDLEPSAGFWQPRGAEPHRARTSLDGALLSHAHLDHSGYVSFLDPEIPIYPTLMTAFISKAMRDGAQAAVEGEVCYGNPREPYSEVLKASKTGKRRPFLFVDGQPGAEPGAGF